MKTIKLNKEKINFYATLYADVIKLHKQNEFFKDKYFLYKNKLDSCKTRDVKYDTRAIWLEIFKDIKTCFYCTNNEIQENGFEEKPITEKTIKDLTDYFNNKISIIFKDRLESIYATLFKSIMFNKYDTDDCQNRREYNKMAKERSKELKEGKNNFILSKKIKFDTVYNRMANNAYLLNSLAGLFLFIDDSVNLDKLKIRKTFDSIDLSEYFSKYFNHKIYKNGRVDIEFTNLELMNELNKIKGKK